MDATTIAERRDGHADAAAAAVSRRVGPASPFHRLETHARRLQWLAMSLVAVIAVVPTTLSFVDELAHLEVETRRVGERLALVITSEAARSRGDAANLTAVLLDEMTVTGLSSLEVLSASDGQTIRLLGPRASYGLGRATVALPVSASPLRALKVEADDAWLLRRGATVLGIHLLVAGFIGLFIYRVPMRSLRHAVEEVERTHLQLVHSDKLSAIGEMYAGLTHEINNPLGIILSRVRLMLGAAQERAFSPELVRDLEMIDRHGTRIAEIIRSLLTFARRTTAERALTDLNSIVRDVLALVDRPFGKQGIRIEVDLDPGLPRIEASHDQLQQVFVNLLNNARDAMPGGGVITLRTYRRGGRQVAAEVADTGPGIPPQIEGRVFEPFFTTKHEGHGTGLGLAVSYGIVSAHGGDIELESRPGHGALFRVTLPVTMEERR